MLFQVVFSILGMLVKTSKYAGGLVVLFVTHPPLEGRIMRLEKGRQDE